MRVLTILLLGILLASPAAADFCEGNFIVEAGDWDEIMIRDGCDQLTRCNYNWKESKSRNYNRHRMNDPTRYNMPAGTPLHEGMISGVSWLAVYNVSYTHMVEYNGTIYTNNTSSMSYKACWMATPCRSFSDMNRHIDDVEVMACDSGIKFCITGHVTDSNRDKHYRYVETVVPLGIESAQAWPVVDQNMSGLITTKDGYSILSVVVPAGILGYRINLSGDTHAASYTVNTYMMQRNVSSAGTEFFEIIDAPIVDGCGMVPLGCGKFIIPADTNHTVNITMFTPFKCIEMNVSMIEEVKTVEKPNKRSLLWLILTLVTVPYGLQCMLKGGV